MKPATKREKLEEILWKGLSRLNEVDYPISEALDADDGVKAGMAALSTEPTKVLTIDPILSIMEKHINWDTDRDHSRIVAAAQEIHAALPTESEQVREMRHIIELLADWNDLSEPGRALLLASAKNYVGAK